ncbi:hypothetical protein PG997_012712, partial [Apiospora hydei]
MCMYFTTNYGLVNRGYPTDSSFDPDVKQRRHASPRVLSFQPLISLHHYYQPHLLREGISIHTCDRRLNKAYMQNMFPRYRFDENFTEHDELWNDTFAETGATQDARSKAVLDDISNNDGKTWVSIISHSGEIRSVLSVLGHRPFGLSTGQAVPVRGHNNRKAENPTPATDSWAFEPTCTAPPVSSGAADCICARASPSSLAV